MATILPLLSLHQTVVAVAACVRAGRVPLVLGPPGVAKTSMARAIAPLIGKILGYDGSEGYTYPAIDCILSNREAVDIGGYPVTLSDDTVVQKVFGTLRDATEWPGLLILDEFLTCSQSVQGPALRLTLERYAGETPLHEHTRIVCLANPPDQAPGGIQLTAALVNRLVILHCQPLVTEVAAYFSGRPEANLVLDLTLPGDDEWTERRSQLMNTAGVLFEAQVDLLCFSPPPASISDGEPFGSPRAWETCCEVLAALPRAHVETISDVTRALVMGSIGPRVGISFLNILQARHFLPTVTEVLKDPERAKRPDPTIEIPDPDGTGKPKRIGKDVTFAAIPLVIEVARVDTAAAWVYVDRLPNEIKAAVARSLSTSVRIPANSPWQVKGQQILLKVAGELSAPVTSTVATGKRKAG